MAARWISLAAALVACRGRDAPAPAPAATATAPPVSAASVQPGAHSVTPQPALPDLDAAGPPANQQEAFAAEPVDDSWKAQTEAELRGKLEHLHGGPPKLECRSTTCLVTVTASEHDARAAVDDLGALRTLAQSMILTAPEQAGDGKLTLHAYVRFAR